MRRALFGSRLRVGISATVVVLVVLLIAGTVWAALWVADNIDAPGPPPTGSGPCTSADSVNIELFFVDGHTVQACTRDRPACPNETSSASPFGLSNQLRSSSRRYIFSVSFDAGLPAESVEQTARIDPAAFMPGPPWSGLASNGTLSAAQVHITPRDPYEDGYTAASGTVTVSSSHGVARGRIDGKFSAGGPTRSDRPAPSSNTVSPVRVVGTFACTH